MWSLSTVCKPRSPRSPDPPPAFSSSSVLGGGLSELDHLLQELNATQFNITGVCVCARVRVCAHSVCLILIVCFLDEILAQFPTTKKEDKEKSGKSAPSSGCVLQFLN